MDPKYVIRLGVPVTAELIAALDAWRRTLPDLPSRPETIRRAAIVGLESLGIAVAPTPPTTPTPRGRKPQR